MRYQFVFFSISSALVRAKQGLSGWASWKTDSLAKLCWRRECSAQEMGRSLVGPTSTFQSEYRLKQTPVLEQQFKVFLRCPKIPKGGLARQWISDQKAFQHPQMGGGIDLRSIQSISRVSWRRHGAAFVTQSHSCRCGKCEHDQERSFAPLRSQTWAVQRAFEGSEEALALKRANEFQVATFGGCLGQ